MKLGGTIDRALSKIMDTPLYRPVKTVRSLLDDRARAWEKWADQPVSLRLSRFIERCWLSFSVWIVRKSAAEPGVAKLIDRLEEPDTPENEHRMAQYSSVMAMLRSYALGRHYQFDWSHPPGANNEGAVLLLSLGAVGIEGSALDESTPQWALSLSRSHSGTRPAIMFSPRSTKDGTLGHELTHELFHMASPLGGGLCVDGHAREILAHRFAVEMSNPVPGLIRYAETNSAPLFNGGVNFIEVMRTTGRRMFSLATPVDGDFENGAIVIQSGKGPPPWWSHGINRFTPSWDDLVLWAKPGSVDFRPPHVHWAPVLMSTGPQPHSFLNSQTIDGLYYVEELPREFWPSLTEGGLLDPGDFAGLAPGECRFELWDISEIGKWGGGNFIEGGRYLVFLMRTSLVFFPDGRAREMYMLLAVEDEDGDLYEAWNKAASRRKPRCGPLLPPMDPQRHEHLVPFDNWWYADRGWREITFDYWAEMMTNKFMRDLSADDKEKRETWEAALTTEILRGTCGPGFVAK